MITGSGTSATAAVAVAVVLFVGGCSGGTNSTTSAPKWNPCTAFPDAALQGVGMDSKPTGSVPDLRCSWAGSTGYRLDVRYMPKASGADWKSGTTDIAPIKINPYAGHTFHDARENSNFLCGLQLETRGADVTFEVTNSLLKDEDTCAVATRIVTGLKDYLPPAP